ncbi:hypothetical protein JRQ81_019866, partial [Phrynocephalus forsythii]
RIKSAWTKLSSTLLMARHIDNMYCTHGDDTNFLAKHPLPNSLIVDATQNRAKSGSNTVPSNKE